MRAGTSDRVAGSEPDAGRSPLAGRGISRVLIPLIPIRRMAGTLPGGHTIVTHLRNVQHAGRSDDVPAVAPGSRRHRWQASNQTGRVPFGRSFQREPPAARQSKRRIRGSRGVRRAGHSHSVSSTHSARRCARLASSSDELQLIKTSSPCPLAFLRAWNYGESSDPLDEAPLRSPPRTIYLPARRVVPQPHLGQSRRCRRG